MTDGLEFDGDQFLLYKDQSTCTGGPGVVRQPTPSANSEECDGEYIFTNAAVVQLFQFIA